MITSQGRKSGSFLGIAMGMAMILFHTPLFPQQVAVNTAGQKIIMYPDGSWRQVEPRDSTLLKQYIHQHQGTPIQEVPGFQELTRNQGEEIEYLGHQWAELYNLILEEDKAVQNSFRTATNNQFKAAEVLETAKENKKLIEPDHLANLTEEYDQSVNQLRNAKLQQKEIRKILKKSNKLNSKPQSLNQNKIQKIRTSFNNYLTRHHRSIEVLPTAAPVAPDTVNKKPSTDPLALQPKTAISGSASTYDRQMVDKRPDHRSSQPYISQPYVCHFEVDMVDKITGSKRRELPAELLFTHTDADLRPFFKSKDLITCRAKVSGIGPYTYLSVEFQIASSHSKGNFGTLAEGSMLRFRLMDGTYVSLYNLKSHEGRIDAYSGHTIFVGQYALGKKEAKALRASELDQMRVLWTTGYEDYDIVHIDLLKDQLDCLMTKH